MSQDLNKLKKAFLELLLRESTPWVTVDPTVPGVDIPQHLRAGFVNFRLTFEHGPQIPDLRITDAGWTATLAFGPNGTYFATVPWEACVQFGDGPGETYAIIWKRDEVPDAAAAVETKVETPRRKFGLVKGDKT